MDKSKRHFLKHYTRLQAKQFIQGFQVGLQEALEAAQLDKFFESYESSYALTLAYPDDIILETARINGIETEGRQKNEIVKELIRTKGEL